MSIQKILYSASLCGLLTLLAMPAVQADELLRPVPTPDMSKISPEAAKVLAKQREDLDKIKAGLVGPPLAQAYADLGALYVRNGFDDVAAVAFYDASQISPADSRWLYLRGVIARKLKHNDDARANFQAALDHDKVYLPIRYRLADTLIDLGDLPGARKLLEDAAQEYRNEAVIYAMLGQLSAKQKRYADAVANINKAIELDPKATELYGRLADAYTGQGNTKAAAEAREKAGDVTTALNDPLVAGLYSIAPPLPQASGTPMEQAQTLARQGHIGAARAKIFDILATNPNDVDALSLSARINASTGNLAIAKVEIEQTLKTKPDSAIANLSRGMIEEYAGDDNKAYEDYQRAQRLDRKLPDTWILLGNAEMRRARYAQAADQYRQLIALLPNTAEAYAHLVAALVAQGKCGDALPILNTALARQPNNGDLMQIFVRLASTCAAASSEERNIALDYGQALYKQQPSADIVSALALAMAAHGKFKEAQEYQAEAIFESARARDNIGAALLKSTTQEFFAKQKVPDRPWPGQHPYFTAPLLSVPRAAPAPAPKP